MKRILAEIVIGLLTGLFIFLSFSTSLPNTEFTKNTLGFSVDSAFSHVKNIGRTSHYTGSRAHSRVRNYIVGQLQDLDLEVHTQSGYVANGNGVVTRPENIVTHLSGTDPQPGSDLLILAHYDSDPHSALGAGDDGSGVAAVLESLRVFLARKERPKNNIIVCFTDAEEIGLLGAELFSKEHPWLNDIGLVLNFEARGTGGPSNAIIETNHGNANLVKSFAAAHPDYPVASSLMYEIYKTMPNDTDATVFRENDDISSFFFAFIDGHYNYHTANDRPENLDKKSLAQQGAYLSALLPYYGDHNLAELQTEGNQVYFNFPIFKIIHYSYKWIALLIGAAWLLFVFAVAVGFRNKTLDFKGIGRGFLALFWALLLCVSLGFFGWKIIELVYPQYGEIQQGFPYNGHAYIAAFVLLSLSIVLAVYHAFQRRNNHVNLFVAPLTVWLLINTGLAIAFKGASYFVVPFLFAELAFLLMIVMNKFYSMVALILSIPALFIFSPLIEYLPVALGTQFLFGSSGMICLLFVLVWPLFSTFRYKNIIAALCLIGGIVYIVLADNRADFSTDRPKPNSLVYILDTDHHKATWNTYDHILDRWSKTYIKGDKTTGGPSPVGSKYGGGFTYSNPADAKPVPSAEIDVQCDTLGQNLQYTVKVSSQRMVNRMIFYGPIGSQMKKFTVNDTPVPNPSTFHSKIRRGDRSKEMRLLTYYAVDRGSLTLRFELPLTDGGQHITLYEASYDLLNNPWLTVPKRQKDMMPRPFVLNDAIVTKKTISLY